VTSQARYREALAEPRFRVIAGSRSLAILADSLRTVALSVLVFETTHSPLLAAITYGIAFMPQVIGGTFLGSLADRAYPRLVISASYLLECVTGVAIAVGRLPISVSLVLVAVVACLTPIFAGASNRLVAEVLTGDAYVLGRSLSNMASSAAQLVGLAFGGLAIAGLGAHGAMLISAGGHLIAAAIVRFLLPNLPPSRKAHSDSVVASSFASNRRLLANARIRILLLAQWVPPAFVTGAESLIIPYASSHGADPGTAGLLLACLPAGMILGDFVVGRFVRATTRDQLTVPLIAVLALPLIALALPLPLGLVAALLAISGSGFAYGLGLQRRFLAAIPEPDRGVAFGLLSTGSMTLQGVGPAVFGAVAEAFTANTAMALAGGATLLSAGVLGNSLRRHAPIVDERGHVIAVRSLHARVLALARPAGATASEEFNPVWPGGAPMTGPGKEIPLLGGDITEGLVRVENTIRRPHQPQSSAVACYLAHLANVGFTGVPRWHGRDDRGRDVLDYIEGTVPGTPPEPWAVTDEVVSEIALLLRRLHDASESFVPPPGAQWFGQHLQVELPPDLERLYDKPELISHCDVTPQNVVFRDGHPVALIDFDMTRPTTRLLDVLDTATWWVPLVHPADRAPAFDGCDVPARLRLFLDGYGLDQDGRDQFLDLAHRAARRSWYLMEATAEQSGGGWARMWADGVGYWLRRRQEWLDDEHDALAAAI
jgi:predicted MFS family arabinose efflux permease